MRFRERDDSLERRASAEAVSTTSPPISFQCHYNFHSNFDGSALATASPSVHEATRASTLHRVLVALLLASVVALASIAITAPALAQSPDDEAVEEDFDFDFDAYESSGDDDEDEDEIYEEEELDAEDIEFEERWGKVEELTVTGKAGQQLEIDAAESTMQFEGAELEAMGVDDIVDIAKITPNLEIRQGDATQANFFIRGVGLADFSANSASAVAIFQDGVPLNAAAIQLVGLFDVTSLAVERGPQGAGSARNATAGAIRIDSTLPSGEVTAQLRSTFGTYNSGDALSGALIQQYEGAVEVPIYEDLLSARVSFNARASDPFMTNGCGDAPPPEDRIVRLSPAQSPPVGNVGQAAICGERDIGTFPVGSVSPIAEGLPSAVGDKGDWAARGIIRFQPEVLDMDWRLNFHGGQLDQQSTLGQAMGTSTGIQAYPLALGGITIRGYREPDQGEELIKYIQEDGLSIVEAYQRLEQELASGRPLDIRPYRGDYNRVGQTKRNTFGTSLRGMMLFDDAPLVGAFNLETVTAFDRYDRFRDTDNDFTSDVLFEQVQDDEAWQFYQELKTTGENDTGTLRWELGGYYLMEQLDSEGVLFTYQPNIDFQREFYQDLWSFAFYGGVGWDFLDDFTLDAGIRYNWERKSFNMIQETLLLQEGIPQTRTWDAPTGLLGLTWRITPDIATYAKYSRGWKGGHFNANRPNLEDEPELPAEPETIDSIEVGARGSWLDARLAASLAFFYYKYKDYQLFLFEPAQARPPVLEVVNASDAEQYGIEFDLNAKPLMDVEWVPEELMGLDLTVRFGWLESQFLDFVNTIERLDPATLLPFQQEENYTGNPLPNAPQFKVSGTVRWPFELGGLGTFTPRYDVDWTDDTFFGPNGGRGIEDIQGNSLPEYTIGQKAYIRHNLRFSYLTPDGMIEVSGWVRNLTDTRYKTYAFDARIFAATVINFVGEPRTAGADISIRF